MIGKTREFDRAWKSERKRDPKASTQQLYERSLARIQKTGDLSGIRTLKGDKPRKLSRGERRRFVAGLEERARKGEGAVWFNGVCYTRYGTEKRSWFKRITDLFDITSPPLAYEVESRLSWQVSGAQRVTRSEDLRTGVRLRRANDAREVGMSADDALAAALVASRRVAQNPDANQERRERASVEVRAILAAQAGSVTAEERQIAELAMSREVERRKQQLDHERREQARRDRQMLLRARSGGRKGPGPDSPPQIPVKRRVLAAG